ncbi:unnamed protein product [Trichobilharzia regenti]|nr:unnamed protein product [Trichobilharzia regenti]
MVDILDTFTRTLQDVSFPDKAGGFTFSDPTDNLANRFILCKTDNDSASSPLDIISLDLGCDEYFLATICRDHRLRLWDFKHRNCFAVLDLLEFLPRTLDLNASLDQSALHSNFAPGLCHRLSSEVVSSHSINIIVYMSMCLSSTANNMMIGLDFSQSKEVNTSYWCWIHMDIAKALNRNRECLSVLQVDPLIQDSNEGALNTYNNNDSYNTEFLSYESNMNSLLKIQKPDISVLDFIPSEIAKKSGGGNESSERGIKSKNALGGIWWLAHQTDTGDTQLDSNYFVRWTEIHNTPNDCDSYKYKNTISTFPPGVNLLNQLPSWHKLPAYIAIQSASQEQLDSLWDETGIDVQLEIFLDHLFHPGCLSWFAITNAFKVSTTCCHIFKGEGVSTSVSSCIYRYSSVESIFKLIIK